MLFHDLFVYSLYAIFVVVLWACLRFRKSFVAWWAGVSLILGVGGSFIPWRTEGDFHYEAGALIPRVIQYGTGVPIPRVIWECKFPRSSYLDYPNPLGFVE